MKKNLVRALVVSTAAVVLAACTPAQEASSSPSPAASAQGGVQMESPAQPTEAGQQNIVQTAQAAGQFSTLLQAAQIAGLADTLASADQQLTVFAPTDEAFAAVPEATLNSLLENPDQLATVLQYHVLAGEVPANELTTHSSVETLEGSSLDVMTQAGKVMVGGATVLQPDVQATNGVIHVIDRVLLPPSMQ